MISTGLSLDLPVVGRQRGRQRRVAHVHDALGRAGFARRVGHVGVDRVLERRLVLLRHRQVRLGVNSIVKRAVRAAWSPCRGRSPGPAPAAAASTSSTSTTRSGYCTCADDAPPHLGPVDRRAGVGRGLALAARLRRSAAAAVFGASSATWNFGRLYSSTLTCVAPPGSPSTRIVIRPISRSRGAVKLPLNEP